MPRKFVDLSIYLENDVLSDPPAFAPKIQYFTHDNTFEQIEPFFPGLKHEDLPDGEGWAVEMVQLSTHNGTHLDAPYHFHTRWTRRWATRSRDRDPRGAAGVVLPARREARLPPLRRRLRRHRGRCRGGAAAHRPHARSRWRSWSSTRAPARATASPTTSSSGCGMGYEATMYLLERGVRLTGTDAWSWDAPFVHTAKKYGETHDASLIWEGHKAGRDIGYCHLEKLHNLESLPADGFFISCFPHKIRGASAGWTRAVAIFDERLTG